MIQKACSTLELGPILHALDLVNPTVVPVALVREVLRPRRTLADDIALSAVGLIAPDPSLFPMQQMRQCQAVRNIRRRSFHRVNDLLFAIHPDVRLHPEVPLFPLDV